MEEAALIALDESTSGNYVTAGGVYVERRCLSLVVEAIADLKRRIGVSESTEIHCRVLFNDGAKRKSGFSHLNQHEVIPFLTECLQGASRAGAFFYTIHCDRRTYPKNFTMFDGNQSFAVGEKHLASYMLGMLPELVETLRGPDYRLIFDNDKTLLEWGTGRRMQAGGFVSRIPQATVATVDQKPFLELADLVAYVYGRALSGKDEPGNRKFTRFIPLEKTMNAHSWTFAWPPGAS